MWELIFHFMIQMNVLSISNDLVIILSPFQRKFVLHKEME